MFWRGWLGVKIQTVTDEIAETLGVSENSGALISAVTPKGPAAQAGIEPGDVVLKFDGKDVTTMRGLPKIVAQTEIGRTVAVEVLRKGQRLTKSVAIGQMEEDEAPKLAKADGGVANLAPSKTSIIGLELSPLTTELRQKYNLEDKVVGVVVTNVQSQSPAALKGVKEGDVIAEAAQDAVTKPDDVTRAVDKMRTSNRKAVLLRVEDSKGDLRFVAVPIGDAKQ